jgi:hypothetical protein
MSFLERLRQRFFRRLQQQSVLGVVRFSCWVALVGLAVMALSIVFPNPLLIIFATSAGQVIGIVAALCYGLAVVGDVIRGHEHPPEEPGPARRFRAPDSDTTAPSDSS